jgi:hypothetical protein
MGHTSVFLGFPDSRVGFEDEYLVCLGQNVFALNRIVSNFLSINSYFPVLH